MLLILAVLFYRKLKQHWQHVIIAASIGIFLSTPLVYGTLQYPEQMQARYRQITVFQPDKSLQEAIPQALRMGWDNISPDFLFLHGDLDATHHPPGMSQLYPVQAVFILLGLVCGLWQRQFR